MKTEAELAMERSNQTAAFIKRIAELEKQLVATTQRAEAAEHRVAELEADKDSRILDHRRLLERIAELESATSVPRSSDDYVAWLRYVRNEERVWIVVCDSDAEGAFKVYPRP